MKRFLLFLLTVLTVVSLVACGGDTDRDKSRPERSKAVSEDVAESSGTPDDPEPVNTESEASKTAGNPNGKVADPALAKDFTSMISWESEGIEFCLPADRDGNIFADCGLNCMVTADCYDADVVAYHEYDSEGETVKKTVGKYTYDFQSFDYLGIADWHMFVIKLAFTDSKNQMEHRYYKIIYNVYGSGYPESQVEKFMATLRFPWFE